MLITLESLIEKHKMQPIGVLHVGANAGQEAEIYAKNNIEYVIWIEALPDVFKELEENVLQYPNTLTINACVGDEDGKDVVFNVANNEGQSSSLLKLGTHVKEHPEVEYVGELALKMWRIESLMNGNRIDITKYDFLNMDLQGAELMALKGMGKMLDSFKYAYIEVNKEELYEGCPLVADIDAYMAEHGFKRAEIKWTGSKWGDAFYINKNPQIYVQPFEKETPVMGASKSSDFLSKSIEFKVVDVPAEFRPNINVSYPPNNTIIFEDWFAKNYQGCDTERYYLPILPTAYHVNHKYGKDKGAIDHLQRFMDDLNRNKKYFTIVQYDDGILTDFKDLDILVFQSGKKSEFPIPLICEPQNFTFDVKRDLFANFIGEIKNHPLRESAKSFEGKKDCYIGFNKHKIEDYCKVLARSKFTLCYRGYGASSFRIAEAMQYGSIPVYISDEFILPFNLKFEEFGVLIQAKDINKIDEILRAIPATEIKGKQKALKKVYEKYYTYQGCLDNIVGVLETNPEIQIDKNGASRLSKKQGVVLNHVDVHKQMQKKSQIVEKTKKPVIPPQNKKPVVNAANPQTKELEKVREEYKTGFPKPPVHNGKFN